MYPESITKLIRELNKLPGVGPKTAERFVFSLLRWRETDLVNFGRIIAGLKQGIHECMNCYNFAEREVCSICMNQGRDKSLLCVVAEAREIQAIEQSGSYNGLYFVLGGNLDTMRGITPERLRFTELVTKVQNPISQPDEIILGLNPNIEGETTTLYLKNLLKDLHVRMTRLARGLPTGSDLEYADAQTVSAALHGRREV